MGLGGVIGLLLGVHMASTWAKPAVGILQTVVVNEETGEEHTMVSGSVGSVDLP